MTDIVERLRTGTSGFITWEVKPIDLVAAAEIERLRAELQDWKAAYYADTKRIEAERDRLRGEVEAARRAAMEEAAGIVERVAIRGTAPLAAAIRARGDA